MREKKIIEYDPASGEFYDNTGAMLFTYHGAKLDTYLEAETVLEGGMTEGTMVKLAGLGYSADEIMRLNIILGGR